MARGLLILAVVCAVLVFYFRDPYGTTLPPNAESIADVQRQFDRVPEEDRQLVIDYLERNEIDVLMDREGNPRASKTARTFGEAIEQQRHYEDIVASDSEAAATERAERMGSYVPLNDVLKVELVDRDMMTFKEAYGKSKQEKNVAMTTFRVSNIGGKTIWEFSGLVKIAWKEHPDAMEPVVQCFIIRRESLAPSESFDHRCGVNRNQGVTDEQYLSLHDDDLLFEWRPNYVKFEGGETLQARR